MRPVWADVVRIFVVGNVCQDTILTSGDLSEFVVHAAATAQQTPSLKYNDCGHSSLRDAVCGAVPVGVCKSSVSC